MPTAPHRSVLNATRQNGGCYACFVLACGRDASVRRWFREVYMRPQAVAGASSGLSENLRVEMKPAALLEGACGKDGPAGPARVIKFT